MCRADNDDDEDDDDTVITYIMLHAGLTYITINGI